MSFDAAICHFLWLEQMATVTVSAQSNLYIGCKVSCQMAVFSFSLHFERLILVNSYLSHCLINARYKTRTIVGLDLQGWSRACIRDIHIRLQRHDHWTIWRESCDKTPPGGAGFSPASAILAAEHSQTPAFGTFKSSNNGWISEMTQYRVCPFNSCNKYKAFPRQHIGAAFEIANPNNHPATNTLMS
jgi:hypothetical protein